MTMKEWKTQRGLLDLGFDQLDQDVESVLRDAHALCKNVRNFNDYHALKDNHDIDDGLNFDMDENDAEMSQHCNDGISKNSSYQVHFHPHASTGTYAGAYDF